MASGSYYITANRWGKCGNSVRFHFLGSKTNVDGDCSHEIKRRLLLGRIALSILDILPTKVHIVKAMVFPMVKYGCESWIIRKAESWRIDAFRLWGWRILLRVPWTTRRSNQSILKEINPEYSLEGLMLKLQYSGHLKGWLIRIDPDAGKEWRQNEKGAMEEEMVTYHHQINGHESKQTPGDSGEQGGLVFYSSWGCKELNTT